MKYDNDDCSTCSQCKLPGAPPGQASQCKPRIRITTTLLITISIIITMIMITIIIVT